MSDNYFEAIPVLTANQIRAADSFTINNEPISSFDLMERAAKNCFSEILNRHKNQSFTIFAGVGNNGGDGLVIYRLLKEQNIEANCFLVKFGKNLSDDCQKNLELLIDKGYDVTIIESEQDLPEIQFNKIVIDALLGVGADRPLKGLLKEVVSKINLKKRHVVSVDMPTGLYSDFSNELGDCVLQADEVYTFEFLKIGLFLSPNSDFFKEIRIVPIGLLKEFLSSLKLNSYYFDHKAAEKLEKRSSFSAHKGTYGHLALFSGSSGMMGASVLSAKAAMRSGVGKCTTFAPAIGRDVLQVAIPEVMVDDSCGEIFLRKLPSFGNNFDAIALGPGIGKHPETVYFVEKFLGKVNKPLVIDADGLNIIAENNLLEKLPKNTILTPHPKEFERLFGKTKHREDAIKLQREMAKKHQVIIVLKGRFTSTAFPNGDIYFNSTGNVGMATAGSGDVLTGIIGSLLAQGYQPSKAAVLGVYFHGLAGDQAAKNISSKAIIASDIVEGLK